MGRDGAIRPTNAAARSIGLATVLPSDLTACEAGPLGRLNGIEVRVARKVLKCARF